MDKVILSKLYSLSFFLFKEESVARKQANQCEEDKDENGTIFFMGKLVAFQEARDQLGQTIKFLIEQGE